MSEVKETWSALLTEAEFPGDGKLVAVVQDWHLLLVKTEDGYRAINDRCTHQASHLSPGRIRRDVVMCPLHGARFELATGRCIGGQYRNVRTFAVRVREGRIEVALPSHGPSVDDLPADMTCAADAGDAA